MNPFAALLLFLFAGGGIALAVICLLTATFRSHRKSNTVWIVVAIAALLLQKGCWMSALNFGKGFGGNKERSAWVMPTVNTALGIGIVWAGALVYRRRKNKAP